MDEKKALAKVLGVTKRDGVVMGVPVGTPNFLRDMQNTAKLKMSKGIPKDYADLLTDEQKAEFKALTNRKVVEQKLTKAEAEGK